MKNLTEILERLKAEPELATDKGIQQAVLGWDKPRFYAELFATRARLLAVVEALERAIRGLTSAGFDRTIEEVTTKLAAALK